MPRKAVNPPAAPGETGNLFYSAVRTTPVGIPSFAALLAGVYLFGYTLPMYQVQQTDIFAKWLSELKDHSATAKILVRIEPLRQGNTGDSKSLGSGLLVLLLCGGDKSSQSTDIASARRIMSKLIAD